SHRTRKLNVEGRGEGGHGRQHEGGFASGVFAAASLPIITHRADVYWPFSCKMGCQVIRLPPVSCDVSLYYWLPNGCRMWEFSVGLYMINIWPDSLLFTALYGVIESASTALFGSTVGTLVDKLTYLQVIRLSWFLILIFPRRCWVVVISTGQQPEVLTKMNSVIRRIDLICKLLAPVFSGFIISFISLEASAVILALWNTLSVWLQYWLLTSVYNGIPALGESSQRRNAKIIPTDCLPSSSIVEENENCICPEERNMVTDELDQKITVAERLSVIPCFDAWVIYSRQEVVLPGVALALLYFTVLSHAIVYSSQLWNINDSYFRVERYTCICDRFSTWYKCYHRNSCYSRIPNCTFTYFNTANWIMVNLDSGITSLFGTNCMAKYIRSTVLIHCFGYMLQWCFLLVCVASVWMHNSITSAWMLMGGVAASRLGLWMFDLAVMQQMQVEIISDAYHFICDLNP
ncbi:hypothetical protein GW17_00002636, partial [Ensete ventricosum]